MPRTYEPIATTTLSTTASEVIFDNITGVYTDLIAVFNGGIATGGGALRMELNNDTGSNYSATNIEGDGSSATSARFSNVAYLRGVTIENANTNFILQFQNYSNTTTNKTVLMRGGTAANGTATWVGLWRSTSAITKIRFYVSAQDWDSGSTFTLYGIKAA